MPVNINTSKQDVPKKINSMDTFSFFSSQELLTMGKVRIK
jgi:hypothetical protein